MANTRKLVIEILGDAKDATKALGDVRSGADKTAEGLTKYGGVAIAAGAAVAGGLMYAATQYEEAEKQSRKLTNSIENSTNTYSRNGDGLRDLAAEIQKKTAADADDIIGMQARLVQYGLQEDEINNLTPLVVDLSRKMGIDLETAGKAVGKAMDGSAGALSKMGIQVDSTKLKTDPFTATMEALNSSVAGFAEEEGQTFSGQLERLKNQLGDLTEGVGKGAIGVIGGLADAASDAAGKLSEIDPAIPEAGGKFAALGAGAVVLVGGLSAGVGQAIKLRDRFTEVNGVGAEATRTLNNAGKAAAAVGAVGTVLGVAQLAIALNDASVNATAVETSLNHLKTAEGPRAQAEAFAEMAESSKGFGDQVSDVVSRFSGMGAASVEVEGVSIQFNKINGILEQIKAQDDPELLSNAIASFRNAEAGSGASQIHMAELNNTLDTYEENLKSSKAANKAVGDQSEDTSRDMIVESEATGQALSAWKQYNDTITASADPIFAAARASETLESARRDVMLATQEVSNIEKIGAKDTDEYRAAVEKLNGANVSQVAAAFGAEEAIANLAAGVNDGKVSFDTLNTTLDNFVARGMITAAQADIMRNKVGGVHMQVLALDGAHAQVGVDVEVGSALEKLAQLRNALPGSPLAQATMWMGGADGNPATPRAAGGPIRAGEPYLVGEKGPELILPDHNGTVMTAAQTAAMRGGGSSVAFGSGEHYHFHGPVTQDSARWVVDQIRSAKRQGIPV